MYRSPLTAAQEETESYGEEPDGLLQNENVKTLLGDIQRITGRTLSTGEVQEIHSWLTDLGAKPEVVEQAYSYCEPWKKQCKIHIQSGDAVDGAGISDKRRGTEVSG